MLSDSRPVEERTREWWESARAKRESTAEALAAAATSASPTFAAASSPPRRLGGRGFSTATAGQSRVASERMRADPAYQGGRAITVEALSGEPPSEWA